jgi:hypothetical protein
VNDLTPGTGRQAIRSEKQAKTVPGVACAHGAPANINWVNHHIAKTTQLDDLSIISTGNYHMRHQIEH